MLILCGILSLIVFIIYPSDFTQLYVGITLVLVAFLNAFLEFYQKYKSEELLKGFMVQFISNLFFEMLLTLFGF